MKIAGMNVSDPVLDRKRAEQTMDRFIKSQPTIKDCACGKKISGNRITCLDCANAALVAAKKIEFIEKQVRDVRHGLIRSIACPYCAGVNYEDLEYCCKTFGKVLSVAWERVRVEEAREAADKVAQVIH